MEKKIFLPNAEQSGKLIEDAWKDFCRQANESGYEIDDQTADGFFKDLFVAGYCYGHNDTLTIIRDQLNTDYMVNKIFEN